MNKEKRKSKIIYYIIIIIVAFFACVAKFLNAGWMLVILCFTGILPIYIGLFILSSHFFIRIFDKSKIVKMLFVLSCIMMLIIPIILPEDGDSPNSNGYAVFMLVRDKQSIDILNSISGYLIIMHIIIMFSSFFVKMILGIKEKNKEKNDVEN